MRELAASCASTVPHYSLGAIGVDASVHGRGFGKRLLEGLWVLSANDSRSSGVCLETATALNVGLHERAGVVEVGWETMGGRVRWRMHREHDAAPPRRPA